LPTDADLIEDIRKTATDWGVVSNASETAKLSKYGMELGTTIIQENADLVALLADELLVHREMNENSIQVWFEEYRNR